MSERREKREGRSTERETARQKRRETEQIFSERERRKKRRGKRISSRRKRVGKEPPPCPFLLRLKWKQNACAFFIVFREQNIRCRMFALRQALCKENAMRNYTNENVTTFLRIDFVLRPCYSRIARRNRKKRKNAKTADKSLRQLQMVRMKIFTGEVYKNE